MRKILIVIMLLSLTGCKVLKDKSITTISPVDFDVIDITYTRTFQNKGCSRAIQFEALLGTNNELAIYMYVIQMIIKSIRYLLTEILERLVRNIYILK